MSRYSPSFPNTKQNNEYHEGRPGISKREYFIAAALTGLLANPSYKIIYGDTSFPQSKDVAELSVKIADALCDKLYPR